MMYLGDFVSGGTIDFLFTTVRSTGLPTAISGPGAAVYKDNSAGESRSGLTLTTNRGTNIALAGIPYHALDRYCAELVKAGHTPDVQEGEGT